MFVSPAMMLQQAQQQQIQQQQALEQQQQQILQQQAGQQGSPPQTPTTGGSSMSLGAILASRFGPRTSRTVSVRSTGSSGGGFRGMSSLLDALNQQREEFNAQQDARFAQVNKMAQRTRQRVIANSKRAMTQARKIGKNQRREINRSVVGAKAESVQSLTDRGLGNTTIVDQQARGIMGDARRAKRAVAEDVARRRMDIFSQRSGLEAGLGQLGIDTFLSRADEAPNMAQTLALLQQFGGGS